MEYSILDTFRHNLYHGCFTRAADALFELADALLTDPQARSLVELSQAPCFRRQWSSLYAALTDGRIDRTALLRLFVEMLPRPMVGERLVLGLDTSSLLRPAAQTAPDRTLVYQANLPTGSTPVAPGWLFSTLVVLPQPVSSWTYVLDNRRVPSHANGTSIGVAQVQAVLPALAARWGRPVLLLDRRYSNAPWVQASAKLATDQLLRARGDQVVYRPAPPPSGKRGRPRKDGPRFKGTDATTHGLADTGWAGTDAAGKPVAVQIWQGLHLRKARDVTLSVIRVSRAQAAGSKRDPRVAWFWWLGDQCPAAAEVAGLYARRFGQEHGYRFDKQDLLWATPQVRTPEQMERWTDLVAAVHNQLVLVRHKAGAVVRPWERMTRPATPRQVRRAMGKIIADLGTPARPPQPRGKSPGRTPGAVVKRAPRCEVIRKTPRKTPRTAKKANVARK
jgi:hypothetical protein